MAIILDESHTNEVRMTSGKGFYYYLQADFTRVDFCHTTRPHSYSIVKSSILAGRKVTKVALDRGD